VDLATFKNIFELRFDDIIPLYDRYLRYTYIYITKQAPGNPKLNFLCMRKRGKENRYYRLLLFITKYVCHEKILILLI